MLLPLAGTACVDARHDRPQTVWIANLSPVELIARSAALKGQSVTVSGYFTPGTDTRALWQSKDAWLDAKYSRLGQDHDYWTQCITLYAASDDIHLPAYAEGPARMTGKVEIIEDGLWSCNAVTLAVTSVSRR